MNEEPPEPPCNCGCHRRKRRHGPVARRDTPEWQKPEVIARIKIMGKRVQFIREAMNLRQEELAEMCGVSRSAIGETERGKPRDLCFSMAIADGVGCPYERFWYSEAKWQRFLEKRLPLFEQRKIEIFRQNQPKTPP